VSVRGNRIVHRYDRLQPEERFRLVLEASARDDERERERLVSTCPYGHYRMSDAAYMDRVDASRDMAFAVAIELGPRLAQLRLTGAIRGALPVLVGIGVDVGAAASGGLMPDEVRAVVDESLGKAFNEAESLIRSQAAAALVGFERVCKIEMRLDAGTVLLAHLGPLHVAQLGLEQLEGVKPDRREVADWQETLTRKWRERIRHAALST